MEVWMNKFPLSKRYEKISFIDSDFYRRVVNKYHLKRSRNGNLPPLYFLENVSDLNVVQREFIWKQVNWMNRVFSNSISLFFDLSSTPLMISQKENHINTLTRRYDWLNQRVMILTNRKTQPLKANRSPYHVSRFNEFTKFSLFVPGIGLSRFHPISPKVVQQGQLNSNKGTNLDRPISQNLLPTFVLQENPSNRESKHSMVSATKMKLLKSESVLSQTVFHETHLFRLLRHSSLSTNERSRPAVKMDLFDSAFKENQPFKKAANPFLNDSVMELAKPKNSIPKESHPTERKAKEASIKEGVARSHSSISELDINRLTDQVYQTIERKLRIEKERRGL